MKIARTDMAGFDAFIIMMPEFPEKPQKAEIENSITTKYGEVTIYFISSKPNESDLWITNKFGVENDHHDDYSRIDFDFVLFKDPEFYI